MSPPLGTYGILRGILWIGAFDLPFDGFKEAPTTVSLYVC